MPAVRAALHSVEFAVEKARLETMTNPSTASAIAGRLGVVLALIMACADSPAQAQSADLVLCDRLAADPSDPDKPADVKGTSDIAKADISTAIRFCKVASGSSRRAL